MQKEFDEIIEFLDESKIKYRVIDHAPVYTSEQAAATRGFELRQGVKSLIFKITGKQTDFVLVLVPGDKKADLGKLRKILGADDIRLADPTEVKERMSCEIGSCHPFGNICGLKTYMDKRILDNETIAFNAGLHTKTIAMSPHDLKKLTKPEVEDFVK
ncbi:hypothetical protein HYZ41_03445 [archaeon]|nr:hypothetical protein [archaeon]